jgi:hypothetical protein
MVPLHIPLGYHYNVYTLVCTFVGCQADFGIVAVGTNVHVPWEDFTYR